MKYKGSGAGAPTKQRPVSCNGAGGTALRRRRRFFTNDDLWGYLFIAVALVFFVMFTIYPLFSALKTSLENYKPFGSDFVGLENYATTFQNELFWKSMKNTLVYTAVVVPVSLLLSFAVAIMFMPFGKKLQSVFKIGRAHV